MGPDVHFTSLEEEFFRTGDELANDTPDDFSDLDDEMERSQRTSGARHSAGG